MSTASARSVIVARLREYPVFAPLSEDELGSLASLMSFREYPKGAFIVSKGDLSNAVFMLVAGRVKISLASPEGRELALAYLEPLSYFGDMGAADADELSADVIATTDVEVVIIEERDLERVFRIHPRFAVALLAAFSDRLNEMVMRLQGMAFHDATHRLMRVMLNVATASYESRGVPVIEGLTHYEIATLAGTSRETASRVVSNLAREGVVATKGRKIVVDLFALRDRVEKD